MKPHIILNCASSADGKIALPNRQKLNLSNSEDFSRVHQLRSHSDAVMVGINTVLTDDPKLTARDGVLPEGFTQPLRVVVDSNMRTPVTSSICNRDAKTLIATCKSDMHPEFPNSISVKTFPSNSSGIDLDALFKYLGDMSVTSVLVEGGSSLLGSLFDQRLVDKVYAFLAPIIIGGSSKGVVGGRGAYHMSDVDRLVGVELKRIDEDFLLTGYCSKE